MLSGVAPCRWSCCACFRGVFAGSAAAAAAAKVWFHTEAAVRLTVTSSLLLVSPSSSVSSPF